LFPRLRMEFLEEPGHVLTQDLHGLQAFRILFDRTFIQADSHVPVDGAWHDHLADEKEVVDGVEGVDGPAPAHRDHSRPHFTPEEIIVGAADQASAIDQGFELGGNIRKVGGRSQNYPIGIQHLFEAFIHHILLHGAPPVFILEALEACNTTLNLLPGELKQFGFNPLFLQFAEDRFDQNGRVSIFAGTPVKSYDLHLLISLPCRFG
jgi:hypothetical protein